MTGKKLMAQKTIARKLLASVEQIEARMTACVWRGITRSRPISRRRSRPLRSMRTVRETSSPANFYSPLLTA